MLIDAIDPKGTLDSRLYDLYGKIYRDAERLEPYMEGRLVQDVQVLFNLEGKYNPDINNAAVDRAIKDVIRSGIYIPTPDIIIEETARYYQLESGDLRGNRRDRRPSLARQIAMYLIKTNTNLSLNQIGAEFGKNHSTVHTSIMKIEELLKSDPDVASTIQDITSNIHSRN